jgi:DNA-nicking Smr family endonuclease
VVKKRSTKISQEDIETWNKFISETKSIEDKDKDLLPTEDQRYQKNFDIKVDLHGHTIAEAFDRIDHLFEFAKEKKIKRILLITGKGLHSNKENDPYASKDLSLLRYAVPDYINKNYSSLIQSIETSPISLGGDGSMIIALKKITE